MVGDSLMIDYDNNVRWENTTFYINKNNYYESASFCTGYFS